MTKRAAAGFFDDKCNAIANTAKVIGHPARVEILRSLMENNHQTCKMLVDQLPYSQSTVSQHLYRLKSVGLIDGSSYKTATIYSVNQDKLTNFKKALEEVFGKQKDKKQLSLF